MGGIATSKITTFWWKRKRGSAEAEAALKSTASKTLLHNKNPWQREMQKKMDGNNSISWSIKCDVYFPFHKSCWLKHIKATTSILACVHISLKPKERRLKISDCCGCCCDVFVVVLCLLLCCVCCCVVFGVELCLLLCCVCFCVVFVVVLCLLLSCVCCCVVFVVVLCLLLCCVCCCVVLSLSLCFLPSGFTERSMLFRSNGFSNAHHRVDHRERGYFHHRECPSLLFCL